MDDSNDEHMEQETPNDLPDISVSTAQERKRSSSKKRAHKANKKADDDNVQPVGPKKSVKQCQSFHLEKILLTKMLVILNRQHQKLK